MTTSLPDVDIVPNSLRDIPAEQVVRLYREVGWWPERTVQDLRVVLQGGPAVAAWHDGEVVAFARAVTDGRFRAFVEDVVVAESWRGSGLGDRLVRELLCVLSDVDLVTTFCQARLVGFYERAGMNRTRQVVHAKTQ